MTPNQATRELYKLFQENTIKHKNVTYDKVKELIDAGARLTGIEVYGGIPIMYALRFKYDISVIRLLAESGGADMNLITPICGSIDYCFGYCDKHPDGDCGYNICYESQDDWPFGYHLQMDENMVELSSIKYILLKLYHQAIGSNYIFNTTIKEYYRQGYLRWDDIVLLQDTNIVDEENYKYLEQCCEIFNITIDELKHMEYELPPDMRDFDSFPYIIHGYTYAPYMESHEELCSCCSHD
jgi:hypothetical protein